VGNSYHFILAVDADTWANHYFLSNKILEPIKQHLKNHKNMNKSYLDIYCLHKILTVTLVCPRFIESVFTSRVNDVIILLTSSVL
jgi:hypothetical protein